MTEVTPSSELLASIKGKVTVLTGGSNGIGAETVRLFSKHGSRVVFCDLDEKKGKALEDETGAVFVKCDVTNYTEQYAMFEAAMNKWGRVDVVVANAGVTEKGNIFAEGEDLSKAPTMIAIDVNLIAAIYTARLGVGYMRKTGGGSLVLISSAAGVKESPGLWVYQPSKHGVYGLMRTLRSVAPRWGVSVNTICPWTTKTGMIDGIEAAWTANNLPINESSDVAMAIAIAATANNGQSSHPGTQLPFNGKALYISGRRFFEIEDNILRLMPQWLGEENYADLMRGQAVMGDGSGWTSKQ